MTIPKRAVGPVRLGVLAGDGIGPEIVAPTMHIVETALELSQISVDWLSLPFGAAAIDTHGAAVPQVTLDGLATVDGWLAGPHDNASYPLPHRVALSPAGVLRKHFDLFANIRPARALPGADTTMDLVIVRENTEGLYADRNTYRGSGEWMPSPDVAISQGVFTRRAIERIAHAACRLARARARHVTVVHKANVLPVTMGMFRDVALAVAGEYPDVAVDEQFVDAMAAHLVRRPHVFDVVLTENMLGDILSDLAGEVSGSLGIAASLNASADRAMAQAAHGAAPDIAGAGTANPLAMVLSAAMLLEWLAGHLSEPELGVAGQLIRLAVDGVLESGVRTPDLGGTAATAEVTQRLLQHLRGESARESG